MYKRQRYKIKNYFKTFYGFNSLNNIANTQKEANTLNKLGNEISLKLKKQINKSKHMLQHWIEMILKHLKN